MLIAVNFHYIRRAYDAPHPGIQGTTPAAFRDQLTELGRLGEFVGSDDIRAAVAENHALPPVAFHVTFDDGFREQYELAWPILQGLGIPALFFVNTRPIAERTVSTVHKIHLLRSLIPPNQFLELVRTRAASAGMALVLAESEGEAEAQYLYDDPPTARLKYALNFLLDPVERSKLIGLCFDEVFQDEAEISRDLYMTVPQVAELASHHAIGTHGHDHVPLSRLTSPVLRDQVTTSVRLLTEWTGEAPFAASYPYGSRTACSLDAASALKESGIVFAFTMERAGNQEVNAHPLWLARFDNNDLPGGKRPIAAAESFLASVPSSSWTPEG